MLYGGGAGGPAFPLKATVKYGIICDREVDYMLDLGVLVLLQIIEMNGRKKRKKMRIIEMKKGIKKDLKNKKYKKIKKGENKK